MASIKSLIERGLEMSKPKKDGPASAKCGLCKKFHTINCPAETSDNISSRVFCQEEDSYPLNETCFELDEEKAKKAEKKATMVPFLITDEFIAEECWDKEKGEAYFLIRYFNGDKIERVDRIIYNGTDYFPLNNPTLKKGLVLLPPGIEEATLAEVFQEACDLTLTMYDAEEEKKDEVKFLVAIAISSWFYDRFNLQIPGMGAFAPIIALRGPSGSGKDRLLNALRLCSYHPFYNVSTKRIPSLYRPMDQWRGTLCLSEMDFTNTSETSELTHYLNCRSYGVPISRQNPDNPKYNEVFYNFGLTIVTQRRAWDDNALEDRSLPYYCEKTQKEVPSEVLDEWIEWGMRLQKKLLYLRLVLWNRVVIDKAARVKGIKDHRLTASVLPLLALSKLEPSLGVLIEENMRKLERKRREVKAMSRDGVVINRLYELWKEDLIGEHNGIKYIAKERVRVQGAFGEERLILVPLQTSDLAEEFKWSTREVRKVLNSLQLHPNLEKLPKLMKLNRVYRPIWVDERRLISRFEEFVPDLVTEVTEVTDNLSVEGSERTVQENKPESVTSVTKEKLESVTSVIPAESNKSSETTSERSSVTSVTSVTKLTAQHIPEIRRLKVEECFPGKCSYCGAQDVIEAYADGFGVCGKCLKELLQHIEALQAPQSQSQSSQSPEPKPSAEERCINCKYWQGSEVTQIAYCAMFETSTPQTYSCGKWERREVAIHR